ncbi:hypothetical protein AKO1_011226 [Acrasis kona]|uniref:Transmembrane protein n=1 Tax=Acrasis kona TaxID=1008807 RepID=A0AAW2YVJ1_9EUKA
METPIANNVQVSDTSLLFAYSAGYFATACFTLQYAPQAVLNYKRKSVSGFSTTGILIKLLGAVFLGVNAILTGEALPVTVYGVFNILQHLIFMVQFTMFTGRKIFTLYLLLPLLPLVLGLLLPSSIFFTNTIKPICQVMSHLPQLYETYNRKSTEGLSLTTQHLNLLGGLAGIYMYSIVPPVSYMTYLVYINSMFQAISLYSMAFYYDGTNRLLTSLDYTNELNQLLKLVGIGPKKSTFIQSKTLLPLVTDSFVVSGHAPHITNTIKRLQTPTITTSPKFKVTENLK